MVVAILFDVEAEVEPKVEPEVEPNVVLWDNSLVEEVDEVVVNVF